MKQRRKPVLIVLALASVLALPSCSLLGPAQAKQVDPFDQALASSIAAIMAPLDGSAQQGGAR